MKKFIRLLLILLVAILILPVMGGVSEAAQKEYVTVINLNLRSSNIDIASPTAYVEEGKRVTYLDSTSNGWFKVKYGSKVGYVHRGDLTSVSNYESTAPAQIHDVKVTDTGSGKKFKVVIDLNIRTANSKQFRSVKLLPMGEQVQHLGTTANGWFKVKDSKGSIGYLYRGDVTSLSNYDSTAPAQIHNVKVSDTGSRKIFKSIIDQNLRTADSRQFRAIRVIPKGEQVDHLGTTANGWFKVKTKDGAQGYLYRGDVTSAGKHEDPNHKTDGVYVGSIDSDRYHYPTCRWAKEILKNNEIWFDTVNEARQMGYVPCKVCNPK